MALDFSTFSDDAWCFVRFLLIVILVLVITIVLGIMTLKAKKNVPTEIANIIKSPWLRDAFIRAKMIKA